jgi:hypothetical protein
VKPQPLTRNSQPQDYFVYPIQLTEPLPEITIPLLGGHTVPLDLQATFVPTYDAGPYSREIDYKDIGGK